jgi:MoaA/NifB/PqqE/SkfB family radical SAM enzyme
MRPAQCFAIGKGLLSALPFSRRIPLSVMFSVTNRCTSKCRYCDIPLRTQEELTTQEALKLIDEMSAAGVRKLSLWGGEPLLRDDIGELIRRAKEKGMCVNIDSNGSLIPEKFDRIKDLDFIILSFDGEKQAHDQNKSPGSYDEFFRAVEYIDGRIPVWTLTVLTKHNIGSVDFIIKKAKELHFLALFQVPYHPPGIGSLDDLQATPREYREAFARLALLKKKGAPVISSTRYLNAMAQWDFFPQTTSQARNAGFPACRAAQLFCNIDTNGDVYPFSPMIGRIDNPPNVLRDGFARCFAKLEQPVCRSCVSACCLEANFVFSLDWLSIAEWMKVY